MQKKKLRISCMSEKLLTTFCLWQCSWTGRNFSHSSTQKAVQWKQTTVETIRAVTPLSLKGFHLTKAISQFETKSKILVHLLLELWISGVWKYNGNHKCYWRFSARQCDEAYFYCWQILRIKVVRKCVIKKLFYATSAKSLSYTTQSKLYILQKMKLLKENEPDPQLDPIVWIQSWKHDVYPGEAMYESIFD